MSDEPSIQSLGGQARADRLSPEQRREIASNAARARWADTPNPPPGVRKAIASGEVKIGEFTIPCAVLEDGTRVISMRGMGKALGRRHGGKDWRTRDAEAGGGQLPYFLIASIFKPFIAQDKMLVDYEPVLYAGGSKASRIAHGIRAELIPNICDVWLKARDAGLFGNNAAQKAVAQRADALMRGLAHVGIISLVDEATGYQQHRDKSELQKILSAYISPSLLPWSEKFPEEFYKEMFRLWGWAWPPAGGKNQGPKGPRFAGKLTKQLVYEKLPPGVIEEIESKNPADEKWQRRARNHQLLTEEIGQPHLEKQVAVITTLMRISPTKRAFLKHIANAFPPTSGQIELFDEEEDDA